MRKYGIFKLKLLAEKYRFDISDSKEITGKREIEDKFNFLDEDESSMYLKNRMYRVLNHPNTYRIFLKDQAIATCAELRGGWAWTNDKRYY